MYKEILRDIDGIGIFPIIGLLIFLGIFIGVIIRLITARKSEIEYMSNLPIEGDEQSGDNYDSKTSS